MSIDLPSILFESTGNQILTMQYFSIINKSQLPLIVLSLINIVNKFFDSVYKSFCLNVPDSCSRLQFTHMLDFTYIYNDFSVNCNN